MKAMVLREFNQPLVLEDRPVPEIGPGEALIRVRACGICATDLKIISGKVPTVSLPAVMGHEIAGEIAALGGDVPGLSVGDRVVVHSYWTCETCEYCRTARENLCLNLVGRLGFELPGAYAQYLKAPVRNLLVAPPHIPFEQLSIFGGAIATPMRAVRARGRVRFGETVIVLGVGGLGIHVVQIAKILGASVVAVDVVESKLETAKQYGADLTVNPQTGNLVRAVKDFTGGKGADVLIEAMGGPSLTAAMRDCLGALKPGARLVVLGYEYGADVALDSSHIAMGELEIIGSRAHTRQDIAEVIEMVSTGKLKPVLGPTYELEQANEALAALKTSQDVGRIVLKVS